MTARPAPATFPFPGHLTLAEVDRNERHHRQKWENQIVSKAPDGTPLFVAAIFGDCHADT